MPKSSRDIPSEIRWTYLHLLYINGGGIDWERVQELVSSVPNYPLVSGCWLVLPLPDPDQFGQQLAQALPEGRHKSELLLCPVSHNRELQDSGGGLGLNDWLRLYTTAMQNWEALKTPPPD